ncbi:MAG: thiamine-phosphate kinase [Pseudomonadota bacterium]
MDEFDWIARYLAPIAKSKEALGLLDDVALLAPESRKRIITQDAIAEGVHFLPETPLGAIATKLVAVNASDIHAKGAICTHALLTLGWPAALKDADMEAFAAAFQVALSDVGALLLGGDTTRSKSGLFASLTMIGECLGPSPILRCGAKKGDDVWVSGEIGHGLVGLADARAGHETTSARHYHRPEVTSRDVAGLIGRYATASMDISDGLLADCQKLTTASQVGIEIELSDIRFADPEEARFTLLAQCTGGDDYKALFCASALDRKTLESAADQSAPGLHRIGTVTQARNLRLLKSGDVVDLPHRLGFSHGQ